MQIFTFLLVLGFLQVWGARNPLHKDAWYATWVDRASQLRIGERWPAAPFLLSAGAVCFLVLLLYVGLTVADISKWVFLPLNLVLLLYSLGRGEFGENVTEYAEACSLDDWDLAVAKCAPLGVDATDMEINDWPTLHARVLDESAYRGFERLFAVLFWFMLLGPVSALFYRLTQLYSQQRKDDSIGARVLWVLDWPAVRVLGLSFCFTGNFVGGYSRWREYLLDTRSASRSVLRQMILGALSVDEELDQNCEVTRKELKFLHKLYARSLWFWLFALAVVTIVSF